MKFFIIDTYYPAFLSNFYRHNPQILPGSYRENLNSLLGCYFGTSDFYSHNLEKLGHIARDVIANDAMLQSKWAEENAVKITRSEWLDKIKSYPLIRKIIGRPKWIVDIVLSQIEQFRPDVVYLQDLTVLNPETLVEIKHLCKLIAGQIASPIPAHKFLKYYDLILTSFPHFVKKFRDRGINSEYFRIGFEPRMLDIIGKTEKKYEVSFIGSFSLNHRKGIKVLEHIVDKIPLKIWGYGLQFLSPLSPIRRSYMGEAWGREMYQILAQSKIVINRHIDTAENFANNMRLYETTGMGAMLMTDEKDNIGDLFTAGKEIETYKNAADLIEKVKYYLAHDNERKKIALAGQIRTLTDHNYLNRMKELVTIINKYL